MTLKNKKVKLSFGFEKSGRITSAFLLCSAFFLSDCSRTKPNLEECSDAQIHISKLIANDETMEKGVQALMLRSILKPETSEAIIRSCVENKSLLQVQCELSKEKFSDLQECKKHAPKRAETEG
ncbi:LipL41-expression chaperone Lep [Leptospira selangorensis]|uniref:LipL41-expression chaperone Lep n=1 Tax=Leptospira selangorensis TaxID=2484982 RepID=A0A4R9G9B8_9LEPT|nr:LipL41-expression chaperone Lep [Leptospira selangorensis]TGK08151.1 LipL41-expression chaperone Lep [Leptospira selangorensis]TGM15444.1 LipL41-expression chaperone Lep [Leptospira selangorensis]TGM18607.1 LipL41-expression chaperone Lep [Leptospira selangorensis]